jgi:hypothetical protein
MHDSVRRMRDGPMSSGGCSSAVVGTKEKKFAVKSPRGKYKYLEDVALSSEHRAATFRLINQYGQTNLMSAEVELLHNLFLRNNSTLVGDKCTGCI